MLAFGATKMTPGESTDGAIFFPTNGKPLDHGRLLVKTNTDVFEFNGEGPGPAGGGMLWFSLRNEAFRERFDAMWLGLPLIGRLSRGYNAARFAGTLAMLAGAGVPILKALQAAAETLSNRALRADAVDALGQVREGAPLASALAGRKRFPGLLAMFANTAIRTLLDLTPADLLPWFSRIAEAQPLALHRPS